MTVKHFIHVKIYVHICIIHEQYMQTHNIRNASQ